MYVSHVYNNWIHYTNPGDIDEELEVISCDDPYTRTDPPLVYMLRSKEYQSANEDQKTQHETCVGSRVQRQTYWSVHKIVRNLSFVAVWSRRNILLRQGLNHIRARIKMGEKYARLKTMLRLLRGSYSISHNMI